MSEITKSESSSTTIAEKHPELLAIWDYEKNEKRPQDTSSSYSGALWWRCDKGHSYRVGLKKKLNGTHNGCEHCLATVKEKEDSIAVTHPEVAKQWDYEKNGAITPEMITFRSGKMIWWRCDLGHSWQKAVYNATSGQQCPYCSGRKVLPGFNDLATTHPEVAAQWDWKNNGNLSPQKISSGSGKKVWWICDKRHNYQTIVNNRTKSRNKGCPYCSNRKVLTGYNDFAFLHPELVKQWDFTKNKNRDPRKVRPGSNYRVWWICEIGHSYCCDIHSRVKGNGCPYCSGHRVLPGFNDLKTTHPDIAQQWDWEKNAKTTPGDISAGGHYKAQWVCSEGHKWESTVFSATRSTGCPHCNSNIAISQAERDIADFLTEILPGEEITTSDRTVISPKELDIYIPGYNLAIEFNGLYWHTEEQGKGKFYHQQKYQKCQDAGINLITIWEDQWEQNPEEVKNLLVAQLGLGKNLDEFIVEKVDSDKAIGFFKKHLLPGKGFGDDAYCYLGIFDSDSNLVAVSSWSIAQGDLVLDGYAYSHAIDSCLSGFLHAVRQVAQDIGIKRIKVVDDLSHSDCIQLARTGFRKGKDLDPDFFYMRAKRRISDPDEIKDAARVWDCGSAIWHLEV